MASGQVIILVLPDQIMCLIEVVLSNNNIRQHFYIYQELNEHRFSFSLCLCNLCRYNFDYFLDEINYNPADYFSVLQNHRNCNSNLHPLAFVRFANCIVMYTMLWRIIMDIESCSNSKCRSCH